MNNNRNIGLSVDDIDTLVLALIMYKENFSKEVVYVKYLDEIITKLERGKYCIK